MEYITEGGIHMKIVVIKSPRFISGVLRAIFGMKKDED
ncbi:MAG: stage V sporulation protein SpoVM [Ruminococcus sp.]|nr:stage V sporulation protein SpoVM [Ruminococcus sp.]